MVMTLKALVDLPELQSRIVSGTEAATQVVGWAHSCELRTPWQWLGRGDLVMTTGMAIPASPSDQEEYVVRCSQAGIVGVAIGEGMHAPRCLDALLRTADKQMFCVIFTAREVPFIAMARAVASAKQAEEQARIDRTERLHQKVLTAQQVGLTGAELLDEVGREIGCHINVVAISDGRPLLPASIGARYPRQLTTHRAESSTMLEWSIPNFSYAALHLFAESNDSFPEAEILRHVSMIAALELGRRDVMREVDRRQGAYLLAHLLDGQSIPGDPAQLLAERGLAGGANVLAVVSQSRSSIELHQILGDSGIPHALLARNDQILVLLRDDDAALALISDTARRMGISNVFSEHHRLPRALIEANLAYEATVEGGVNVRRIGESPVVLLPQSAENAQELVDRVLGPLLALDTERNSKYTLSLQVFLEENRSWLRASRRLCIHKQTLVYRMARIADLTGYSLDRTDDVATLWLALKAAAAIGTSGCILRLSSSGKRTNLRPQR